MGTAVAGFVVEVLMGVDVIVGVTLIKFISKFI